MSIVASPMKPVSAARGEPRVNIIEKTDEEILAIADRLWRDLVKYSNEGKYGEFTRNFSNSPIGYIKFIDADFMNYSFLNFFLNTNLKFPA